MKTDRKLEQALLTDSQKIVRTGETDNVCYPVLPCYVMDWISLIRYGCPSGHTPPDQSFETFTELHLAFSRVRWHSKDSEMVTTQTTVGLLRNFAAQSAP